MKKAAKKTAKKVAKRVTRRPAAESGSRSKRSDPAVVAYERALTAAESAICRKLRAEIDRRLPDAENKVWHAHPVWFLDGNPIVGYSKLKDCVRLLFWSGQSFEEKGLHVEGKFKAAEARYASVDDVDTKKLGRWLKESRDVQWDYKNLIKRKGRLERLNRS